MVLGPDKDDNLNRQLDEQGDGQSAGVPADGALEGNAYNPMGGPGINHWQASFIRRDGLDERSNIFFAAVEMTRMPMVITDPRQHDNPIVFANRAFLDLSGYAEEEVLGRNCRMLQGPDTDPGTVEEMHRAIAEERAFALDVLNYKADGTPFWNALFVGPIFDQGGELLYYFASQMDITERRMSQESWLQAQKLEAIGQLTAGMAHDFNNLLQVINGNLELSLLQLDKQHASAEPIRRAQRAAMKAAGLTQQLLTFARKQRLEPRSVNLNRLVVEFSDMLVRTLGEAVELHLGLQPGLPSCTLDPTHLEMALLNVLINARDAMPAGGHVTVTTETLSDSDTLAAVQLPRGRYVTIAVRDEGEGMTEEVRRRATEPFFTTKGPGTGLGLAMVYGFVRQSHGRLQIDSAPGAGTCVRMIFPVAVHETAQAGGPREAPQQAPAAPEEAASVLVVEDNDDVRELAESVLRAEGYAVLAASSGEHALALLDQHGPVDLLFTDVIMPGGMNGLQLAERVRADHPAMPILVTSGYMEELPGRAKRGEPLDVLAKPYQQGELLARVRAALR